MHRVVLGCTSDKAKADAKMTRTCMHAKAEGRAASAEAVISAAVITLALWGCWLNRQLIHACDPTHLFASSFANRILASLDCPVQAA